MIFRLFSLLMLSACLSYAQTPAEKPKSNVVPVEPSPVTLATPPGEAGKFELFLLIGQSNMAGRGEVTEADRVPDPRILVLGKEGAWGLQGQPVHTDRETAGTGLGFWFAQEVAEHSPGVTVGLIPSAVGGTRIALWQPGQKLYENAVRRAKIAMKSGTLKGILWHQGEADSRYEAQAGIYGEKLQQIVEGLRRDLEAPNVPFIAGELGDFMLVQKKRPTFSKLINEQIAALPQKFPFVGVVKTEGLMHKGDNLHFNAESLRTMGKRYYEVWSEVAKEDGAVAAP